MGAKGHGSRCKTLLTNVTEVQGCVIESFRGGCGQSSFFMTYPFCSAKTDLEKAFRRPDAPLIEQPEKPDSAELSESERSKVLLEHPGV